MSELLTTQVYQHLGVFAIIILASFQLFLWSKENRELKIQVQDAQLEKQFYKVGFMVSAGWQLFRLGYNFIQRKIMPKSDSILIRRKPQLRMKKI